jgi:anti-sigma factor RsiW
VNRCLTEGRRAFVERLAGIEAGSECERLMPLVSALADGEASAEDLATLRPHLKTCLACRARLREFRAAPKRVAALLPPIAVAAQGDPTGPIRSLFESLVGTFGERATRRPSWRPVRRWPPSPPPPPRLPGAAPASRS